MGLEFLFPLSLAEDRVPVVFWYSIIIFIVVVSLFYIISINKYKKKAELLKIHQPTDLFKKYTPLRAINWSFGAPIAMIIIKGICDYFVVKLSSIDFMIVYGIIYAFVSFFLTRILVVLTINISEKLTPPVFKYRKLTNWWGTPKY